MANDESRDFCAEFISAGGDASTVGPIPLSSPRELLSESVRNRLQVMGDLEPPATIAPTWTSYREYFIDVRLSLEGQSSGATLDDDDLIQRGLDLYPQSRIVRNFILTTCTPSE